MSQVTSRISHVQRLRFQDPRFRSRVSGVRSKVPALRAHVRSQVLGPSFQVLGHVSGSRSQMTGPMSHPSGLRSQVSIPISVPSVKFKGPKSQV